MELEKSNASPTSSSPRRAGRSQSAAVEAPPSPSHLQKQLSQRASCLCSPTTHAGSFRCRHHRGSLRRDSSSFSALSDLDGKEAPETNN